MGKFLISKYQILCIGLVAGLSFLSANLAMASSYHAPPIDLAYNENMIDDYTFTNKNSMSAVDIQNFLNAKGPTCDTWGTKLIYDSQYGDTVTRATYFVRRGGTTPFICLKDFSDSGLSAAQIIYNTAQKYDISPQVILVTLQKEQSLITDDWPWPINYEHAMGMACPETAPCDPANGGFINQVESGSRLLKAVYNKSCNPGTGPFYEFTFFNTFRGIPRALDGVSTNIGSCATAALYQYTPHRVDSAWIDRDGINYYGNYNFVTKFISYFGSTTSGFVPVYVYRFWNTNGTHFYTASDSEKNNIIARWPNIYKLEGVAYTLNAANPQNNIPLFRFYNKSNGTHFYTASDSEKNNIIARWPNIYQLDGIAYNVSNIPGGTPVYRFWNINGTHFYTASTAEADNINRRFGAIYKFEGVAYYIY